jgi:hypothetical protein
VLETSGTSMLTVKLSRESQLRPNFGLLGRVICRIGIAPIGQTSAIQLQGYIPHSVRLTVPLAHRAGLPSGAPAPAQDRTAASVRGPEQRRSELHFSWAVRPHSDVGGASNPAQ